MYFAKNCRIYPHKESPKAYVKRHDRRRIRNALKGVGGVYLAKDGGIYERKEKEWEFIIRKLFGRKASGSPRRLL